MFSYRNKASQETELQALFVSVNVTLREVRFSNSAKKKKLLSSDTSLLFTHITELFEEGTGEIMFSKHSIPKLSKY